MSHWSIIKSDINIPNMMVVHIVVNGENIEYDDKIETYGDIRTMPDKDWQDRVKGLLKAELKKRGVGYKELAEKLGAMGIHETPENIANKIARGGFTAVFLIQCLRAIGADSLRLD